MGFSVRNLVFYRLKLARKTQRNKEVRRVSSVFKLVSASVYY